MIRRKTSFMICRTVYQEQSQLLAMAVALMLTTDYWSVDCVLKGDTLNSFSRSFSSPASSNSSAGIHMNPDPDFENFPKKGHTKTLPCLHWLHIDFVSPLQTLKNIFTADFDGAASLFPSSIFSSVSRFLAYCAFW